MNVLFVSASVEIALNRVIPGYRVHGTIVNRAIWENQSALKVNDLTYREVDYKGPALYDEGGHSSI